MSAPITTAFGEAVPPAPRHSVTVHMGRWDTVEKYGVNSSAVIPHFKNAYPRMKPHRDIVKVRPYSFLDATPNLICPSTNRSAHCPKHSVARQRSSKTYRRSRKRELLALRVPPVCS